DIAFAREGSSKTQCYLSMVNSRALGVLWCFTLGLDTFLNHIARLCCSDLHATEPVAIRVAIGTFARLDSLLRVAHGNCFVLTDSSRARNHLASCRAHEHGVSNSTFLGLERLQDNGFQVGARHYKCAKAPAGTCRRSNCKPACLGRNGLL